MELIHVAFLPVNVVFTVLLLLVILYWIMVILGGLDVNLFDVDLGDADIGAEVDVDADFGADVGADVDADIGADVDADMGADLHADIGADMDAEADAHVGADGHGVEGGGAGALHSVLHFFYIGEVPVMILASIFILSCWTISVIVNYYLNPSGSLILGLPILAGDVFVSAFICKVFAMPLKRLFEAFDKDANAPRDVMGRICIVSTTTVSKKMGQAEVSTKGAPLLLNVVSDSDHVFRKGDEGVITGKDKKTGVYTIAPVDLEK
jgi:hypothetical protein